MRFRDRQTLKCLIMLQYSTFAMFLLICCTHLSPLSLQPSREVDPPLVPHAPPAPAPTWPASSPTNHQHHNVTDSKRSFTGTHKYLLSQVGTDSASYLDSSDGARPYYHRQLQQNYPYPGLPPSPTAPISDFLEYLFSPDLSNPHEVYDYYSDVESDDGRRKLREPEFRVE